MPSTFTIPLITVISGQTITASLWNGEFENIDSNFTPAGMDDYSANDTQMQTTTDPYPASATSRPTSLQGEIERLRYLLTQITGEAYWYIDPDVDIATFKTRFDAHTHSGASNQGPQITASGLASDSVTTEKILDANVTHAKIAAAAINDNQVIDVAATKITGTIATAQIANSAVDENKLAASVAGSGITGGAGTPLAVGVDNSTIEINSDAVRVKDAGITQAKLATAVVNKLGQNIGLVSLVTQAGAGTAVNYSGQGKLKGVTCTAGATGTVTLTVDGVAAFSGTMNTNDGLIWSTSGISSSATGKLNSLEILFNTSLVITLATGGTIVIAYERAA